MLDCLEITVHGKVVGKGRPHFIRKTGVAITPARTRSYESVIRDYAMAEMQGKEPWEGRVKANILAVHEIPKSWNKKKLCYSPKYLPLIPFLVEQKNHPNNLVQR